MIDIHVCIFNSSVATCNKVKMPIDNLAKIFGPTVVGYSSPEVDQHKMIHETTIQKEVCVDFYIIR